MRIEPHHTRHFEKQEEAKKRFRAELELALEALDEGNINGARNSALWAVLRLNEGYKDTTQRDVAYCRKG